MKWIVHGERMIYESAWVNLALADVEVPAGRRFEHHVIRSTSPAAGVVVVNDDNELLLLWRHRFITDTWSYEIPAGGADPGEDLFDAARREVLEETGWAVENLSHLVSFHPTNGNSDQVFNIYLARGAEHVGEPTDPSEAERIEWVPAATVFDVIAKGELLDGLSLTGLLYAFATGAIPAV